MGKKLKILMAVSKGSGEGNYLLGVEEYLYINL